MSGKLNGKGVATPPVDAEEKFDAARRVVRQLLAEARAKDQELETLRAQLRLAHDEASAGDKVIGKLQDALYVANERANRNVRIICDNVHREEQYLLDLYTLRSQREQLEASRWFRAGRFLGLFR